MREVRIKLPYNAPLPPYGELDFNYLENLSAAGVPDDWQPTADIEESDRTKAWAIWRDKLALEIADVLWPVFDRAERAWVGRAAETMSELTRSDLHLMTKMQTAPDGPEFTKTVRSPLRAFACPSHETLFRFEDDGERDPGSYHDFYDITMRADLRNAFTPMFYHGIGAKVGQASIQFKSKFQRPRAYQVGALFGIENFVYRRAKSSMTPSLSSGHCLQGLMAVGTFMEQIVINEIDIGEKSWEALQQYAVDIGDRRVMAGVHYPSDNISSWIIAMNLADQVFIPQVKKLLWDAIVNCSYVYQQIVEANDPVYRPSLSMLEGAATGSAVSVPA